jgi:hypothetical protein
MWSANRHVIQMVVWDALGGLGGMRGVLEPVDAELKNVLFGQAPSMVKVPTGRRVAQAGMLFCQIHATEKTVSCATLLSETKHALGYCPKRERSRVLSLKSPGERELGGRRTIVIPRNHGNNLV